MEAFAAHPKIGDMEGLRTKYRGGGGSSAFADMSKGEQAAAAGAPDSVLQVGGGCGRWWCCRESWRGLALSAALCRQCIVPLEQQTPAAPD